MILSNAAIRRRPTVMVLIVLIVIAGAFSYTTLPREAAPDVPIPLVLVTTPYEGVAPEDVETSITMKIESELGGLKGVKEIRSTSAEGLSMITIEFDPDMRIEDALQYVRDKVDQARGELPAEAEETIISEINVAEFPIMMISVAGDVSAVRLKAIADELEDVIEEVPGVLDVDVLGGLEREIRLEIDQDKLATFGLTIPEILQLIPSEHVNISAGGLETAGTKFNVRVPAEFVEPESIEHLVLATRQGRPIYFTDVARVRDTFKDRTSYARLDGESSITVAVKKRVGENIVAIAEVVKTMLDRARAELPDGVSLQIIDDQSEDIHRMISDLENNIFSGLVLVLAVLVLFLGLRTSLIVALAIPMSMLMSFFLIQALGYTLNMIVLFGLILALGMLVDNAIVVVENIYRHMELGYGRIAAARKGAAEVAWPVIASTATTVAAFMPLLFWPGIMGDFMKYLPITVIIVLSSSLFVALVINPVVCTLFASPGKRKERTRDHWFLRGYRSVLSGAMNHKYATMVLLVCLLAGTAILYGKYGAGVQLFPEIDPRRSIVNIRAPQGTNINRTNQLALLAERRIDAYADELRHVSTNVGSAGGKGTLFGSAAGPHMANITLIFPDYAERARPSAEVIADVRGQLTDIAGGEVKVEKERQGPPTGDAVSVRIVGEEFAMLEEISQRAKDAIADVPGLVNLRSDLEAARPELSFEVDRRRASLLGVNTAVVGNFLKTAIFGSKVGIYRQFNDEYDITVRLPREQRDNIEDLLRLRVPNATGDAVPLSSLGTFRYRGGYGTINRVDQKRVVTLSGDAEGRLGPEVLADVSERLSELDVPAGYRFEFAGEKEEQDEAVAFLSRAFIFAVLLIIMILVTQFNTLSVPMIIMTTVILSMIGVLAGLLATALPFVIIMTGIGVISLAGVVVNNAIVLLDYTRQLQTRGLDLVAATVQAGMTRLRPVLLTAVTTILGLMPMATGMSFDVHTFEFVTRSESSEWWRSLAIAVIFGLSFATILTLIAVPVLYVATYRVAARLGLGGLQRPEDESADPVLEDF